MKKTFQRFAAETSGAVTTNFVVMTAALVGLGIGSVVAVRIGATDMGQSYTTALTSAGGAVMCFFSSANDCDGTSQMLTSTDGGSGTTTGTVGGIAGSLDYALIYLTADVADRLANEIRLYSADQVQAFIRNANASFYTAFNLGVADAAANYLDLYALGVVVLSERYGYEVAAAAEAIEFQRTVEYFKNSQLYASMAR